MAKNLNEIFSSEISGKERFDTKDQEFKYMVIDNTPYLDDSFALRYNIYCEEMEFLNPDDYTKKIERDIYDDYAIHIGAIDKNEVLIGTARLVLPSSHGLPLLDHCNVSDAYIHQMSLEEQDFQSPYTAEVSRLALSRLASKRINEDRDNSQNTKYKSSKVKSEQRRYQLAQGIYKFLYQESKRRGITQWFAAMEKSLLRLLHRYKGAFRPIGEEVDYYGPVTPYLAKISEIEKYIH